MLEITLSDGDSIATLSGELTFNDHTSFRAVARRLVASASHRIAIDVTGLRFIDSAGLGMFLLLREEAAASNRSIALRNARGQVKRMFDISRFETLFLVEA